jgi:hypothetical protein
MKGQASGCSNARTQIVAMRRLLRAEVRIEQRIDQLAEPAVTPRRLKHLRRRRPVAQATKRYQGHP